eukprot:TRINITY_DN90615_c0_g1_i1.p1 TRINITY_DN90615_c0_g1~~TRINITY_DN90615_c0_g1_i1.p1  ORF type:complete len:362 (+),score=56.21 TRINITY_DN90615_c0_g1_i1:87-1172(+)
MAPEPPEKRARTAPKLGKVIIDTDPGVDDFLALCLAFASTENFEVLGLTIVAGGNGGDTERLAKNGRLAANLCGQPHVKVVKGARMSLTGADRGDNKGFFVHGEHNALGNIEVPAFAYGSHAGHEDQGEASAAQFLVDSCAAAPGEVTIIALGPLTNLAEAVRRSSSFAGSVKQVVIMGGAFAGDGYGDMLGNKMPCAEANFHNDPEAAKLCFNSFSDITVAGLNVTGQLDLIVLRERLLKEAGEAGRLIHAVTEHYVEFFKTLGQTTVPVHDPSAILALIDPTLFDSKHVCVDIECQGELTQGMSVADWRCQWKRSPQTHVLVKVQKERAHDLIVERLSRLRFPDLGELRRIPATRDPFY